ncbi:uncharacterized protein LOC121381765 [Gigantopelta aegis]|uniref:uncharacterized protein LOC121381765 n=1 Tax=Gigantopelta aegis TaxID=1735272 RepID=UPI001B88BBB9|nr:uncharacterized protein LOC121381765 [Gigantopelta aegis]
MPPKMARPLTGKERQKKWRERQKANLESHQRYLQAESERYTRRIAEGKRKRVADMTERELRKQRRKWKRDLKAWRQRQKTSIAAIMTPPQSPHPDAAAAEPQPGPSREQPGPSVMKTSGRKKIRRDRAKAYRTIEKLTVKLQHEQLRCKRVQKRYERACAKLSKDPATPRSESKKLLQSGNLKSVQRDLTFSFALARGIKERYRELSNQREKQLVRRIFLSAFLKKYHMAKHFSNKLGISRTLALKDVASMARKRRRDRHSDEIVNAIRELLLRDDNSMMRPGKKDKTRRRRMKCKNVSFWTPC